MPYIFLVPFVGHHSSFVIGKGGSTIKKLVEETGCFIKAEKSNVAEGRPLPFFHIEGPNEKMVNQATIRIQTMLMTSMMRNEKTIKSQIDELVQQNQFLELKVVDQTEEADVEDEHISVDMGPPKQTLVNDLKGKDPCAKSVCTGSPICCNCCERVCCRCSRSKEWSHYPSGHMVPPPWNP
jgi:hypothetical protein